MVDKRQKTMNMRGRRSTYGDPIFPDDAFECYLESGTTMKKARLLYIEKHEYLSTRKFEYVFRLSLLKNPEEKFKRLNDIYVSTYQYNAVLSKNEQEQMLAYCLRTLAIYYYGNHVAQDNQKLYSRIMEVATRIDEQQGRDGYYQSLVRTHIGAPAPVSG